MVAIFPDGQYEHGATWNNANDRVMWERSFTVGSDGQRRMAQAMITANPSTPAREIRDKMTGLNIPPAPPVLPQPTISDVLGVGAAPDMGHMYDRSPTDFSGTSAGRDGTSYPSLSAY